MIEVTNLTKRYRSVTAVENLTFRAESGCVTGFLGPNGAGKSTAMRMILGLDLPDSGSAVIDGKPLVLHPAPLRSVGALLDAAAAAEGMTARRHLSWIARAAVIPERRIDEVLELVGLISAEDRQIGSMSLGMRQRLGIAAAMLGDPANLVLDEPINGLDPDGVLWMRTLLRRLADEGRTVLLSSHLMAEMQLTADRVVVIGRGRLVAELPMSDLESRAQRTSVIVRAADQQLLVRALREAAGAAGITIEPADPAVTGPAAALRLIGIGPEQVGDIALRAGTPIHELTREKASLEEIYMQLTHDVGDYRAVSELTRTSR